MEALLNISSTKALDHAINEQDYYDVIKVQNMKLSILDINNLIEICEKIFISNCMINNFDHQDILLYTTELSISNCIFNSTDYKLDIIQGRAKCISDVSIYKCIMNELTLNIYGGIYDNIDICNNVNVANISLSNNVTLNIDISNNINLRNTTIHSKYIKYNEN